MTRVVAAAVAAMAIAIGLSLSLRRIRARTRADETYAPSDGAVVAILGGGIAFVFVVGLMIPWPLCMGVLVPATGAAYGLGHWYWRGHLPTVLRRARR